MSDEPVDFAVDAGADAAEFLAAPPASFARVPVSFEPLSFDPLSLDAPESLAELESLLLPAEPPSLSELESLDLDPAALPSAALDAFAAVAAELAARESVLYQPLPLKTIPTGWMILRSVPPHCSHVVKGGSV